MISRSARSDPAAFIAWRIETKSIGVAPSALSALTTSASDAPLRTLMRFAAFLLDVDLAAFAHHGLAAGERGWLADDRLGRTR